MTTAVYAGSFDPLTLGHLWVINQAAELFDHLIVAIGDNPQKKCTFSVADRLDMVQSSISSHHLGDDKINVDYFNNQYLVNYAKSKHARFIIRGVRNSQDFEYEKVLRNVNSDINTHPEITTIFVVPPRELCEVSSSIVKSLCGPEGWEQLVCQFVPSPVFQKLKEHHLKK